MTILLFFILKYLETEPVNRDANYEDTSVTNEKFTSGKSIK